MARGVQMEAYSVEDKGAGVQFNVYVYNNQPGISINYETGRSKKHEGCVETKNAPIERAVSLKEESQTQNHK